MSRTANAGSLSLNATPILGLAAFVTGVLAFTPDIFNDPDTYWHLATGEWVLRRRAVPTTDPFSWSFNGHLWTAHEWLVDVLLALGYRAAGWSGVAVLTSLAAGAVIALAGLYLRRALPLRATLIFLVFVVFGMAPSLLARPHVFALPILTVWLVGLLDAREEGRAPSPWLLPLMLIWANAHASFVVGLGLVGVFALEALIGTPGRRVKTFRDWAVFGVIALVLAFANPQGLQGILYPFQVMHMKALPLITEWQSARFDKLTPFQAVLFEGLFFTLWLGVRVPPLRLLMLLGMLYLALSQARQQIIFVIVASLLLRDPFAQALKERFQSKDDGDGLAANRTAAVLFAIGFVGVMCLRLALPIEREDDEVTPRSALAAVPPDVRSRRVLNGYNLGGYLIFRGVPTFIDGRSDMYGDAFVIQYSALPNRPPGNLAKELDAKKVGWVILEPRDPLVRPLSQLPGWRRLYADKYAVVHIRTAVSQR
jgi:hypothetical protein